jgi:hypothetical protein
MEGQHMPLGLWVFLAAWVYVIQPVGGWLLDHPTVAALLLLGWWLAAVLNRLTMSVQSERRSRGSETCRGESERFRDYWGAAGGSRHESRKVRLAAPRDVRSQHSS